MEATQCQNWAYLKEDTPFNEIFPTRSVPIRSIFPIIPREAGSPPCYVVDPEFLTSDQINQLAEQLFYLWQPECESLQMAKDYISQGLPLKCDWFTGAGSSSPAVLFGLMDDEGFRDERDADLEDQDYDDNYNYDPDDYDLYSV